MSRAVRLLALAAIALTACGPLIAPGATDGGGAAGTGGAAGQGGTGGLAGGGGAGTGGGTAGGNGGGGGTGGSAWPWTATSQPGSTAPLDEVGPRTTNGLRGVIAHRGAVFITTFDGRVLRSANVDAGWTEVLGAAGSGSADQVRPMPDGGLLFLGAFTTTTCGGDCALSADFNRLTGVPSLGLHACAGVPNLLAVGQNGTTGVVARFDGAAWSTTVDSADLLPRAAPLYGLGPQACAVLGDGTVFIAGEVVHRLAPGSSMPVEEVIPGLAALPARPQWKAFAQTSAGLVLVGSSGAIARRGAAGSWQVLWLDYAAPAWDVAAGLPDGGAIFASSAGRGLVVGEGLVRLDTPASTTPYSVLVEPSGRYWIGATRSPFTAELWRLR